MKYKQNEMMDFIVDLLEELQKDNDFDGEKVKQVIGTELKKSYPLTRYYIPRDLQK